MCVVFLASNHAEHIKVLNSSLCSSETYRKRDTRQRERLCLPLPTVLVSVSEFPTAAHISHSMTSHHPTHTHLNKWTNAKEWDTVRKEDKTFYPQCWICHNAVLSSISSPVPFCSFFYLMGFLLGLGDRDTQCHLFLTGKRIKTDYGVSTL